MAARETEKMLWNSNRWKSQLFGKCWPNLSLTASDCSALSHGMLLVGIEKKVELANEASNLFAVSSVQYSYAIVLLLISISVKHLHVKQCKRSGSWIDFWNETHGITFEVDVITKKWASHDPGFKTHPRRKKLFHNYTKSQKKTMLSCTVFICPFTLYNVILPKYSKCSTWRFLAMAPQKLQKLLC